MQNKLQELTDKLYNEGLAKGQQQGEEMVAKAKQEATNIIAEANEQAKAIVTKAKKEAEEFKTKIDSDIKIASVQTISVIKQKIGEELIKATVSEPVKQAFSDKDFVQKIIGETVKAFDAKTASISLEVILPTAMKGELDLFLKNTIAKIFGGGFEVRFDKGLSSGFKIGPKDGSYYLSFTDQDFEALFSEYLRPATRKILFGK